MRGKQNRAAYILSWSRITPAHAGKTIPSAYTLHLHRDHPRACGENGAGGSVGHIVCRITPAHAGKTHQKSSKNIKNQDHPRACGENPIEQLRDTIKAGSPPRMRGKLALTATNHVQSRITPAHAGKTQKLHFIRCCFKDHPRACGENCQIVAQALEILGSPPRMRGKRQLMRYIICAMRITPAHAGKTKCFTAFAISI